MSEQKQAAQPTTQLATRRYDPLAPIGSAGGLRSLLEANATSIAIALPKHVTPERLIKTLLVAANRTPDLLKCTQSSILETINRAAELGLDLSGTLGEAYPIPFGNQCQLIIGYRGMEKLAWQTGEIESIDAEMVHEGDDFKFRKGSNVSVDWSPCLTGNRGRAVGAYCCVKMKNGGTLARFLPIEDIEKIRNNSRSKNSPAWRDHYDEMGRKCAIKRTLKDAPLSTEKFSRAMEYDSEDMGGMDVTDVEPSSSGAAELKAKFAAAKQLDNTPTVAPQARPQPSTAATGSAASTAHPGASAPVPADSEPAGATEAEIAAETPTQDTTVRDVPGQMPIFQDAPLPDVPKIERKNAAATAHVVDPPETDPGFGTEPVDSSVFPQGPKEDAAPATAPATPARKTWQQFVDECSTLADNVCVATGFIPERMSTQLVAAIKSIAGAKGFSDDDSTRETILTAIEEQRGRFAFLAPPAQQAQTPQPQAESATAASTAAPASEPLPPDWQTFAAAYSGLSSVAGNTADVTESGLKKIALRKGWLGAKASEAANPAGQKFMGEILSACRAGKWDWANAKPVK